jgi:alkaline phosphatase D
MKHIIHLISAGFILSLANADVIKDQESLMKQPLSKILFGSCIKQDQPMPILERIVAQKPDLFAFLGDNIYADTTDMEVMQAKYNRLKSDDGFNALRQACPILATWDDHDYGVNDGGADYPKRRQAEKVFLDFWGDPLDSARRQRPGIYESRLFGPEGKRVQFILLDTRYFRGPLKKGERRTGGPYYPSDDTHSSMLGEAQWKWVEQQLRQPAEIRIIVSGIQFVAESSGQETWSNLPHERKRLLNVIAKTTASGVLVISGDRHWAELSAETVDSPYPIYDLTSSSLNQPHGRGTPTKNHYRISSTTYHQENYGEIHIDWTQKPVDIQLKITDIDGNTQIEKNVGLEELQFKTVD